jgi:hypothetical protein
VTLAFNIVDLSPRALFFLVQEPIMLLSRHLNGEKQLARHEAAGGEAFGPPALR